MSTLEFDLLKMVGAALLGSALTFLVGRVNEWRRQLRDDQQHLLHAGLFLLEWTQLRALHGEKGPIEFQREQWRLLVSMSTAVASVRTRSFRPFCVAVSRFALLDHERTDDRAMVLFKGLISHANPPLARAYEAQLASVLASSHQPVLSEGHSG